MSKKLRTLFLHDPFTREKIPIAAKALIDINRYQ